MQITKQITRMIITFAVLVTASLVFMALSYFARNSLERAHETRNYFIAQGYELDAAVLELTYLARTFVEEDGYEYFFDYYESLNLLSRVRQGFVELDVTDEELWILDQALEYHAQLRWLDAYAWYLNNQGMIYEALEVLYSPEHYRHSLTFYTYLNNFDRLIFSRIVDEIAAASRIASLFNIASIVLVLALGGVVMVGTFYILRRVDVVATDARTTSDYNDIVLAHSPLIMNIWDKDLQLVQTSQQVVEVFGVKDKQEYMDRFYELSPEFQPCGRKSTELAREIFIKTFETKGSVNFEWMHQTFSGEPVPMDVKLVYFESGDQKMLASYGTDLRPIRAVMQKEQELSQKLSSVAEVQSIFEKAPIAVNIYSREYELLRCNPESVRMFGFDDRQAFLDAFDGSMVKFSAPVQEDGTSAEDGIKENRRRMLTEDSIEFNWTFIDAQGEKVPSNVKVINITSTDTPIMVMFIQDLREINAAEVERREASELNQIYLDSCPMFIAKWDDQLNVIDCNETTLKIFGVDDKEDFVENYSNYMPTFQPTGRSSMEFCDEMVQKALEDGFVTYNFVHTTKSGQELPVHVTNVRVKRGGSYIVVGYNHDLREINAAYNNQKREMELNQALLDTAPFVIGTWNDKREMTKISKFATEFLGLKYDELADVKLYTYSPKTQPCGMDSRQKAIEMLELAYTEGFNRFDWVHEDVDGNALPTEVIAKRFKYNNRDHVVTFTMDMREVNEAMANERKANALTRTIFDSAPLVITLWDQNRNILQMSDYAVEMFGVDEVSQVSNNLRDFSPVTQPDGKTTAEKSEKYFKRAFEEGFVRFDWVHQKADGEIVMTEIAYRTFEYEGEKMLVSYTLDITAIREANEQAGLMVDATPLSCFIARYYDEEGGSNLKAIDCNRAAIRLFGLENKEKACKDFYGIFEKGEETTEEEKRARHNEIVMFVEEALINGSARFEYTLYHRDGTAIICDATFVRVLYRGEPALACFFDDIRETKKMIAEIKRIGAAEEESRAKTRFLARMSHEIRTPMNSVIGITNLEIEKTHHPAETLEAFMRINTSSYMLLGTINDILDLSKAEAGKLDVTTAEYDLTDLIVDTLNLNLALEGEKQLELKLELNEELPSRLIGDELRLKQILNNLLSNAFKYTKEGHVILRISMIHLLEQGADEILLALEVEDTGQGMTRAQVNSLFVEEYVRFNSEVNKHVEGSGLGMMIVQELVSMMDGDVKVESVLNEGTVFMVHIPQRIAPNAKPLGAKLTSSLENMELTKAPMQAIRRMKKEMMPYGRVLVVDDVETNIFVAKGILESYKIDTNTVLSGLDAIELIERGEVYDIIFMDHMMPIMDGLETTRTLRNMGYTKPIVALTANALRGVDEMFLESGFDGFIAKPIDASKMDTMLKKFISDVKTDEEKAKAKEGSKEGKMKSHDTRGLTEAFLLDARRAIKVIEQTLEKDELVPKDVKAFATQVHAMKSALINIGQPVLSRHAEILEENAKNDNHKAIKEMLPVFLEELVELTASLAESVEKEKSKINESEHDDSTFVEMLDAFVKACENFDVTATKTMLDEASNKKYSNEAKELLKEISANLLFGDFDEAAELARKGSKLWISKK